MTAGDDDVTEPAATFVPDGFAPPTQLDHPDFRLRPLTAEHNGRDHVAWMESVEHIRATPGFPYGTWPQPMSLDANRGDLERHHEDFLTGRGFTYTVLAPDGPEETAEVIGCVYLYPDREPDADVHARSWVVADHADLDGVLARTVREWLESDVWPWEPDHIRDHPRPGT